MNITKERIKEILTKAKTNKELFNWCDEYEQFIRDCVHLCVSSEVDYILEKSWEDSEAPFSYEDIDLRVLNFEEIENKFLEWDKDNPTILSDKIVIAIKKAIEEENIEELNDLWVENDLEIEIGDLEDFKRDIEVFEWWVLSDPLKYRLEQQGEVFIGSFWGRCTTGQSVSLDYCCIKAFLSMLKDLNGGFK